MSRTRRDGSNAVSRSSPFDAATSPRSLSTPSASGTPSSCPRSDSDASPSTSMPQLCSVVPRMRSSDGQRIEIGDGCVQLTVLRPHQVVLDRGQPECRREALRELRLLDIERLLGKLAGRAGKLDAAKPHRHLVHRLAHLDANRLAQLHKPDLGVAQTVPSRSTRRASKIGPRAGCSGPVRRRSRGPCSPPRATLASSERSHRRSFFAWRRSRRATSTSITAPKWSER